MAAGDVLSPSRKLRGTRDERLVLYRIATKQTHPSTRTATGTMHSSPVSNLTAFRLENYKHEQKMDLLEKEKKQCIHRFKEDKHIFKMSVKLPKEVGDDRSMEKYGGKFKANGDYRDSSGSSRTNPDTSKQNVIKHQCTHRTKSPVPKTVKCKTVADLIALMRNQTPNETSGEQTPSSGRTSRTDTSNRNENLRLLLENYEVFVPSRDDWFGDDEEEEQIETGSKLDEQKRPHSEDPSWSLHKIDDIDKQCNFARSKSAQTTDERLKLPIGSKSEIKFRVHSPNKANTSRQRELLRPTIRQVVTEYVSSGRRPREYFWNSPSKRLNSDSDSPQDEHEITAGGGKLYDRETPHCESNSRQRVSFASMVDNCHVDEYLMIYKDKTVLLTPPREEIDGNKKWKLNENKREIKGIEQRGNKKWKVNGNNQKKDADEEFPSSKLKNHLKYLIQEKSINRCQKQERLEEELPIKVFNPEFPVDYRKLRRILQKNTTQTSAATHVRASSRAAHVSSRYPDRSTILNELDFKYTGLKQNCRQPTPEQLASECEKVTPSSTKMMVFGKGLQRVDEKDQQANETRQKMDEFFARLQSTTSQPSTVNIPKNRPNSAVLATVETQDIKHEEHQNDYKRAAPWPVQIWC